MKERKFTTHALTHVLTDPTSRAPGCASTAGAKKEPQFLLNFSGYKHARHEKRRGHKQFLDKTVKEKDNGKGYSLNKIIENLYSILT